MRYRDDIFLDLLKRLNPLLRMRMPLGLALKTLHMNPQKGPSQRLLRELFNDMREGVLFAESLSSHLVPMPESYSFILNASEESQKLSECIQSLVVYLELRIKWKQDFYAAIRYPSFILSALLALLLGGSLYLVPQLKSLIEALPGSQELPLLTKIVFVWADRLPLIFASIIGGVLGGWVLLGILNKVRGKSFLTESCFKCFGRSQFYRRQYWGYLCQYLGMVIGGGMDLYSGLKRYEVKSHFPGPFKRDLQRLVEGLEAGKEWGSLVDDCPSAPSMLGAVFETAQLTDRQSETFSEMGALYLSINREWINRLLKMIEPIALCLLGLVITICILSVCLPLIRILDSF